MARDQASVGHLLPLLETSDLRQLERLKALINEQLSTERGSVLLNGLVDYYLETSSSQALQILTSVREPHDKHLLDKLNESLSKPACRLPTLGLLGHVVRKQPSWIHKISRFPLLASLLRCLKTDSDVLVLITGALVLITLLPMIPQAGRQHLYDFFDVFGRLAAWNLRNQGHVMEVFLIHLRASVYSLFHRLYGMYPCNFISYLRSHYSMKENMDTFQEVVKPMLEHVRIHPELVTGTKDYELDPSRWKTFEIHDIVIECAKVSLDPKEASCEEGYSTLPDQVPAPLQLCPPDCGPTPLQLRPPDCSPSPYADLQSSHGISSSAPFCAALHALPPATPPLSGPQPPCDSTHASQRQVPIWSPSSICGMATPPSTQSVSPTNALELSQNASQFPDRTHIHATPAVGRGLPPSLTDEFIHPNTAPLLKHKDAGSTDSRKPCLMRQEPIREQESGGVDSDSRGGACERAPMTLSELSVFMKEQEQCTGVGQEEELLQITQDQRDGPTVRGYDLPFYRTTETLTGPEERPSPGAGVPDPPLLPHGPEEAPSALFTPIEHPPHSPEEDPPKYGPSSPSPRATPPPPYRDLFSLALPKAASLFVSRWTNEAARRVGEGRELGEGFSAVSPLEVLDRLILRGSHVHDRALKSLPLPNKSADWSQFGAGSAPLAELQTLRSQLLLLHSQLLYERYKREQHAVRNRRLLRRVINATALQERNSAMKARLSLQEVDRASLRDSLQVEQHRHQQLWADRETLVTGLHKQIRLLQQSRDEHYRKNQELQSKLREQQKRIRELEAELQRANSKVCLAEHQLNQLSVKLSSSESAQQQMVLLNRQLLLLGEANRLCVEELQHSGQDSKKEAGMLQASSASELEKLQLRLVHCGQGLDAAQQCVAELESQLAKKEHLIAEQRKFLEDVKGQARVELQASEGRYQSERKVSQALQSELLQLYSRLETERPDTAPGGATEPCGLHYTRPEGGSSSVLEGRVVVGVRDSVDGGLHYSQRSNSSTLSPGKPPVAPAPNSVDGSQEPPPSRLADAPLLLGAYPSAESFLGIQNRKLFGNKRESRREEGEGPVATACVAGLSQVLKTEPCAEPAGSPSPATPTEEPQGAVQRTARGGGASHVGGVSTRGRAVGGAGRVQQRQLQHQRRL